MTVTLTLAFILLDLAISILNRYERHSDIVSIREAVSSSAAEARITARTLNEQIQIAKRRWDFLSDHNPQITAPSSLSADPDDLERVPAEKPSPTTPVATPSRAPSVTPIKKKSRHRSKRASATPKPWYQFFKNTR